MAPYLGTVFPVREWDIDVCNNYFYCIHFLQYGQFPLKVILSVWLQKLVSEQTTSYNLSITHSK